MDIMMRHRSAFAPLALALLVPACGLSHDRDGERDAGIEPRPDAATPLDAGLPPHALRCEVVAERSLMVATPEVGPARIAELAMARNGPVVLVAFTAIPEFAVPPAVYTLAIDTAGRLRQPPTRIEHGRLPTVVGRTLAGDGFVATYRTLEGTAGAAVFHADGSVDVPGSETRSEPTGPAAPVLVITPRLALNAWLDPSGRGVEGFVQDLTDPGSVQAVFQDGAAPVSAVGASADRAVLATVGAGQVEVTTYVMGEESSNRTVGSALGVPTRAALADGAEDALATTWAPPAGGVETLLIERGATRTTLRLGGDVGSLDAAHHAERGLFAAVVSDSATEARAVDLVVVDRRGGVAELGIGAVSARAQPAEAAVVDIPEADAAFLVVFTEPADESVMGTVRAVRLQCDGP